MSFYPPSNRGGFRFSFRDLRYQLDPKTPRGRLILFMLVLLVIYTALQLRDIKGTDVVDFIALMLGRILGLLLGFALHEWSHANAAYRIGGWRALPDTKRLTLDPRAHLDPIGTLLALVGGFGWAKPVPVNPSAFYPREREGMLAVAMAGPAMNLVIAFAFGILMRILYAVGFLQDLITLGSLHVVEGSNDIFHFIYQVLITIIFFNILLFFFNLIPLFPLDGWKILIYGLPDEYAEKIVPYERESMYVLYAIILIGLAIPALSIIGEILSPLVRTVFELMTGFDFVRRL